MMKSPFVISCALSIIAANQAHASFFEKLRIASNHTSAQITQPAEVKPASADPKQILLDQVNLGESAFKEEIVTQALERLDQIAPNDPQVIAAHLRQSLRLGKSKLAAQQLEQLKKIAPNSEIYHQALTSMSLSQPKLHQQLQQARILALGGKYLEAKKVYDELFKGNPSDNELAIEYWVLVAKIPDQKQSAYQHLQSIYQAMNKSNVITIDPNSQRRRDLVKHALANLIIEQADKELIQNKLDAAQKKYQQAFDLENNNIEALVGFGDVALKRFDYANAEKYYKQALQIKQNLSAYYGLLAVYKHQSPEKAINYANQLPKDIQARMQKYIQAIESNAFQLQAERFEKSRKLALSIINYEKALKLSPDDVWLNYSYAKVLQQANQSRKALSVMHQFALKKPKDPTQVYATALFLSGIDLDQQALAHINTLPKSLWTADIRALYQRLTTELAVDHAVKLRTLGDKKGAIAYLHRLPQTTDIELKLADWALEDGEYLNALEYYRKIKQQQPNNLDASLGEIESLIALKRLHEARVVLLHLKQPGSSLNAKRRIANDWDAVGDPKKALELYQQAKANAPRRGISQDSSLLFRDAGLLEKKLNQPKLAKEDYRQAMVSSGITPILPMDNDTYTYLTRNHADDDWLKRGIRSDAAVLYKEQDIHTTIDEDYWSLQGTPGISDLTASNSMAQVDFPVFHGRGFLRNEFIKLDTGTFVTSNGLHFEDFGTCATLGCTTDLSQTATGDSFAAGWFNDKWLMDLGTTPLGFDVSNIVGSLGYNGDFKHISWTLLASRRPLTNSLLSFAGTRDPNTGIIWGGVVATGPLLSLSYDRGGKHGFWSNLEADTITGKNVFNNQRVRLMEGYYYKIINEDNRRLTIGLNNMVWHYQKDLSGYTLGQGGYYSPQMYVSFAVPVYYRKRTSNWSYEVGGLVNWTNASTQNTANYPLPNILPSGFPGVNSITEGGSSSGPGYSLLFLLERRLSRHLFLGAGIDIQRTRDFTPSHALIYLRHSWDGWKGDMDLPPRPLIPYADYR